MWMDKSSALSWLAALRLPRVVVPRFERVAAAAWRAQRAQCLARIAGLHAACLAVRSDRVGEGEAQAGAWLSLLGVDARAPAAAIDRVFASYGDPRRGDAVLVQRQVQGARIAGVSASRALPDGAPYRVTSFVLDASNSAVTAASSQAWMAFERIGVRPRGRWQGLRDALARTLEALVQAAGRELEIEWLWSGGRLHVVQVRALCLEPPALRLQPALARARRAIVASAERAPRGVLAWMPDWNPAELLGEHPRPLALSLFTALIAARTWSRARAALGYAPVAGALLQPIAGRPYVRVAQSLASWLPATLAPALRARIVAGQLRGLRARPQLHDRIEFELACSAFEFGEDWSRRAGPWPVRLLRDWRSALLAQAPRLYDVAALRAQAERARFALRGERAWPAAGMRDWLGALARLREDWALPFAQSARRCFAWEALLRSAERLGAVSARELAEWRAAAALPLPGESLEVDWRTMLRPGTFEIASLRIGDRDAAAAGRPLPPGQAPTLAGSTRRALDALCRSHGLACDAAGLQAGFLLAHRARDWGKLVLATQLSAGLEALVVLAAGLGCEREELSWLTLRDLRTLPASRWRERIDARQRRHAQDALLRMPALIDANTRLEQLLLAPGRPVYLGCGRIAGPLQRIALDTRPQQVPTRAILLLERCEPGFDWVFARHPRALITAFGGPNAHVALRAHELGVPALLGVGPEALQRMAAAPAVEVDFDAGWWRALAAPANRLRA